MVNAMKAKGDDSKESFKNLAQKLKSARDMISQESEQNVEKSTIEKTENVVERSKISDKNDNDILKNNQYSEEEAKKLIKEKKYAEAIVVLRKLDLINPKKSVYFADQIRFLEKIIVNKQK